MLRLIISICLTFLSFSFPVQAEQKKQVLVYERSEDPWNNSWGKTYTTEAFVSKNNQGHILHTSNNRVQIFDPNTFAVTEAVDIMFELKIKTDKKTSGFEKDSSWSIEFDRPNNTSNACSGTPLNHRGEITSEGKSEEVFLVNGKETSFEVISVVWKGYWRSCYSGNFVRKIKFSPTLGVITLIDYVYYYNNSVSGGYKIVLKEIK